MGQRDDVVFGDPGVGCRMQAPSSKPKKPESGARLKDHQLLGHLVGRV